MGARVPTFTATEAWQFQIQEHAQGAGWSAAADADVIGADADGTATGTFAIINSTGESNAAYECQYIGKAAYIRPRMLLVTAAGASHSGSSVLCMTAQKLGYKYPPVT